MILCVPPHQARSLWPLVEPILKRATDLTAGRFTTDDVLSLIERGSAQLWVSHPVRAVCATEIIEYPNTRYCRVIWAAGDLDQIKDGLPLLKAWAKDNGCSVLRIEGRKGWLRALPDFREEAVILRMEL